MDIEREISREQRERLLSVNDIDCAIITGRANMRYVSGFGGEGCVYLSAGRSVFITDSRYTEAAARSTSFDIERESASRKRWEILQQCIDADNAKRVGYEDREMLVSEFAMLRENITGVEFAALGGSVSEMRQVKKPFEIGALRKAEAVGDKAFEAMLGRLKPGMTELEAAAELEYELRKAGGEGTSFDTIMASGINSSMPHAVPGRKVIENGDFVTMDFGCMYGGYCSDMTRTVVIGKASDWQKEIYSVVLEANLAVIENARPGMTGKEIDHIARKIIDDAGYGEYFGHSLGHGIGLEIHEEPNCSPNDNRKITAGMIESDEPGIYVPGKGGVRIEDMLYYTDTGLEVVSKSPKELIEL
ncbi:MAG: aminopeptidase P family protein [Anaerovoracaceae bacterium]|jgi:Xaa-Pro aminopeptidase